MADGEKSAAWACVQRAAFRPVPSRRSVEVPIERQHEVAPLSAISKQRPGYLAPIRVSQSGRRKAVAAMGDGRFAGVDWASEEHAVWWSTSGGGSLRDTGTGTTSRGTGVVRAAGAPAGCVGRARAAGRVNPEVSRPHLAPLARKSVSLSMPSDRVPAKTPAPDDERNRRGPRFAESFQSDPRYAVPGQHLPTGDGEFPATRASARERATLAGRRCGRGMRAKGASRRRLLPWLRSRGPHDRIGDVSLVGAEQATSTVSPRRPALASSPKESPSLRRGRRASARPDPDLFGVRTRLSARQ
jgi:hypothetical protein